jgi:hypothetical protein
VRFKALADRKKHVYDEDIEALVDEEIATAQDHIKPLGAVSLGHFALRLPKRKSSGTGLPMLG